MDVESFSMLDPNDADELEEVGVFAKDADAVRNLLTVVRLLV